MKGFTRIAVGMAGIACAITSAAIPMAQAAPVRTAAVAQHRAAAQFAAPAGRATVLINCHHNGVVAPARFVVSCADRRNVLVGLSWRSWRRQTAFGHGWDAIDNCKPTCVAGHYQKHPVIVVAWRIGHLADGHRFFTRLMIIFTEDRPPAHMPRFVVIPITRLGPA